MPKSPKPSRGSKKPSPAACRKAGHDLSESHSPAAGRTLAQCGTAAMLDENLPCRIAAWRLSVIGSSRSARILSRCGLEQRDNPGRGMVGCCNECIPGVGRDKDTPVCVKRAPYDRVGPDGRVHSYCRDHAKGKPMPPAGYYDEPGSRDNPGQRKLSDVGREIAREWKDPYFGAEPYLREMQTLDSVDDFSGQDRGHNIVLYFLANSGRWRGPTAKRLKNELREMVGMKTVKNPGGHRHDDEDGDDGFDPNLSCPMCHGPGGVLGQMGNRIHCQCRNCGWDFNFVEVSDEPIDMRGNPASRRIDRDTLPRASRGAPSRPIDSGPARNRAAYDAAPYALQLFHLNGDAESDALIRVVCPSGCYCDDDRGNRSLEFRFADLDSLRSAFVRVRANIDAMGRRMSWAAHEVRSRRSVLDQMEEAYERRDNPSVRPGSGVEVIRSRRTTPEPPPPRRGRPRERPVDLLQNEMRNLADRENNEEGRFYEGDEWSARHRSASGAALVWVQEYLAGAVSLGEAYGASVEDQIQKAARLHGYYMEPVNAEVMAFYPIDAGTRPVAAATHMQEAGRLRGDLEEYLGRTVRSNGDRAFFTGEAWRRQGLDASVGNALLVMSDSYVAGKMSGDSPYGMELQDALTEIAARHGAHLDVINPETVAFYKSAGDPSPYDRRRHGA